MKGRRRANVSFQRFREQFFHNKKNKFHSLMMASVVPRLLAQTSVEIMK